MVKIVRGKTKNLLDKAKESCLLAVDVYNKPKTSFRSGAFIVLMSIAWTSLFHAIFQTKGIKYYYRKKDSRYYQKIDGEPRAWELGKCVEEYCEDKGEEYDAIKDNINLFIPLRNRIEHRFMPELDDFIFGECQSSLHNFEQILTEEFGEKHSINESLVYSLQFSKKQKKNKHSKDFEQIKDQIIEYRTNLPDKIFSDPKYCFKAALIQVNNPNRADCAIKFVHSDDLNDKEREQIENVTGIVKVKYTPIADLGNLKSGEVAKEVQKELSKKYGMEIKFNAANHHNKCCLEYKIRPKIGSKHKERTNKDFCAYNEVFDGYTYSPKWVKYLIENLSDKNEFLRLFPHQQKQILGLLNSKEVTKNVKKALKRIHGPKIGFGHRQNTICARNYGVRSVEGEPETSLNEKYCIYGSNGFLYTSEWVAFLIDKLGDKNEFLSIFPNQENLITNT